GGVRIGTPQRAPPKGDRARREDLTCRRSAREHHRRWNVRGPRRCDAVVRAHEARAVLARLAGEVWKHARAARARRCSVGLPSDRAAGSAERTAETMKALSGDARRCTVVTLP